MKGPSRLALLLGVVTLLCTVTLDSAASARQPSALSSEDGHEQEDGVMDSEQGQNEEISVMDKEEGEDQEADLIERGAWALGPGEEGNSTDRGNFQAWINSKNRDFPNRNNSEGADQTQEDRLPSFTTDCECGRQPEDATRIVGGVPTTRGKYPWQAALLSAEDETLICGGTLINNLYILTAAHCVLPFSDPAAILVRLRDYNLDKPDQHKEITKNVAEIIPHNRFDPYTDVNYDIALLKLESALTLSQLATVSPICLPSTNTQLYETEKAIATGWGLTYPFASNPSNVLNEVKLRVISNDRCRNSILYIDPSSIKNNMLCAGNDRKNTCYQDDGGPLAYLNNDGYYEQIGVTSFSIFCGWQDEPSVFTRVNKFLPWIRKKAVGATYCSGFSFP